MLHLARTPRTHAASTYCKAQHVPNRRVWFLKRKQKQIAAEELRGTDTESFVGMETEADEDMFSPRDAPPSPSRIAAAAMQSCVSADLTSLPPLPESAC
jgi:hypothetical protein